ncbi:hypothetical protein BDZ45DRAFT_29256 [Acephala macrosclerotiorum]|nr:hypothetical protein BDZ45DRAFT_29256 [Acephala macrosclerotiorum]
MKAQLKRIELVGDLEQNHGTIISCRIRIYPSGDLFGKEQVGAQGGSNHIIIAFFSTQNFFYTLSSGIHPSCFLLLQVIILLAATKTIPSLTRARRQLQTDLLFYTFLLFYYREGWSGGLAVWTGFLWFSRGMIRGVL